MSQKKSETAPAPGPVEAEPKPQAKKPAAPADELFVYIGPNIHGVIQSGMVLTGKRERALASVKAAVEQYPLVAELVVPARTLAQARIKVRTPGNLLNANYAKLATGQKTK